MITCAKVPPVAVAVAKEITSNSVPSESTTLSPTDKNVDAPADVGKAAIDPVVAKGAIVIVYARVTASKFPSVQ